jgi:hypothetical protein
MDEIKQVDDDWIPGYPIRKVEILTWLLAYDTLTKAKALELDKRRQICETVLEGTHGKVKIKVEDEDFNITVNGKVTLDIDEEMLNNLAEANLLTVDDLACFKWKLQVNEKIHKLPKESHVWKAITLKPATPGLTVKRKDEDDDGDQDD